MTLSRRRFLTISAAFAATPALAQTTRWKGRALGAEVDITIQGPRDIAERAISEARRTIRTVEGLFSLHDPASTLSGLNRTGSLDAPPPEFTDLMQIAIQMHTITGGLFDPTVQPLWRALAEGGDPAQARALIGWSRVAQDARQITLDAGQELTLNGIAQGYATDLVADAFANLGLADTLVDIGEHRGTGGPWWLGLEDPEYGYFGTRTITTGAIETSSPGAVLLNGNGHILHPTATPKWSTVSVQADGATVADAVSTALTLADKATIQGLLGTSGIRQITLIDHDGNLSTLT